MDEANLFIINCSLLINLRNSTAIWIIVLVFGRTAQGVLKKKNYV